MRALLRLEGVMLRCDVLLATHQPQMRQMPQRQMQETRCRAASGRLQAVREGIHDFRFTLRLPQLHDTALEPCAYLLV
jgi:hypothetical protein